MKTTCDIRDNISTPKSEWLCKLAAGEVVWDLKLEQKERQRLTQLQKRYAQLGIGAILPLWLISYIDKANRT